MSFDWSAIEERGPDCPSEPALERLHLDVGEPEVLASLRAHVDGCEMCTAHMERLALGFDAVPDVDPRALLAGVRRGLDEPEAGVVETAKRWWRWLFLAVPVAAAIAIWALSQQTTVEPLPEGPRFKGDFAFKVHRQVAGGSELMMSGDRFAAGDRLRLVVNLPEAGRVAVWGLEAKGAVYRAWPFDAKWAALPEGHGQELAEAIELDDAPGKEVLTLVFCPGEAVEPVCTAGIGGLACPETCRTLQFALDKGP